MSRKRAVSRNGGWPRQNKLKYSILFFCLAKMFKFSSRQILQKVELK